ncbi:MAG: hypothetical protein JWO92_605 [Chitinophagaceae bacterium]|nr:hypothetical protein [Chitinophagaceae bacterium]MDB5224073.1 hypothetical protein [Chitinophagaceae bacterium]
MREKRILNNIVDVLKNYQMAGAGIIANRRKTDIVAVFLNTLFCKFLLLKIYNMKLSNAALLLLTGIAIGAVAGVLLAPEEGSKTSKKLLKKAKKYKKILDEKVSDYKEKATDLKDNIEGAAKDVKKRFT